ncbi:acyltransferase family protein [Riemerella anatipestifer]|uniref:acyltransferase family protein n=1 Tax=Riemerella anatipestifer TaxID=34085 RepID=UPI0021F81D31|nr:acyltransferase [Riemerella anatipestifer]MCW0486121.1 acyltransferase [Riemerella anatipestifer]
MRFRLDIQGLRAFAVFIVLFFHLGFLNKGYLGVDIFFVISGFLITGIIYGDFINDQYSVKYFYKKRIKRILPLVLIVEMVALVLGVFFMLPDDMENLAQSVIATNFFSNNILQYITTGNYWDVVNEYKPLLHTWSLGIEEQYYLFFPLIFLLIRKRKDILLNILIVLTICSLVYYIYSNSQAYKFYMLPTRFFQISIGGVSALIIHKFKKNNIISDISFVILLLIIFVDVSVSEETLAILSVILTCLFIIFNEERSIVNRILTMRPIVFLGTISFSIYMWHQIVISFYRYIISNEYQYFSTILLILLIILLSIGSYYFIEEFFRREKNISFTKTLLVLFSLFVVTNATALYIYYKGGVVKDYPELNIYKNNAIKGVNSLYNDSIYSLDRDFSGVGKLNVLIIGDSYGRDWANVLLESSYKDKLAISYIDKIERLGDISRRLKDADVVFVSYMTGISLDSYKKLFKSNDEVGKVWIVGTKNFGINNGVFYNNIKDSAYFCSQRASIQLFFNDVNIEQNKIWKDRYINILEVLSDTNNTVPVFTNNCKFISQDCRHLTKDGAIWLSGLIDLEKFLKK